ncbi:MAG: NHL repeat-containing protein [Verrucomicrobiota bacterium]
MQQKRYSQWIRTARMCWVAWLLGVVIVQAQDAVTTLNPGDGSPGYANGPLAGAKFNDPAGLVFDTQGNLFVADSRNHVIRKVAVDGTVSLLAGTVGEAGFANGNGAGVKFDTPFGVALAGDGSLLVADTGNHILRRVDMSGVVTTYAGWAGTAGNTNGTLAEARFRSPLGLKRDTAGNIWVADSGNHTVRRITPAGLVETVAGVPDAWGAADGPAASAKFNGPVDVAVAVDGRVFISDGFNHVIRCLGTNGMVTTIAGLAGAADWADGQGAQARFWNPAGLAFDHAGNLYVADSRNHVIRKVAMDGVVTTVSGSGRHAGLADGVNRAGRYFNPYGLAFDAGGNLVVSDSYNQTLRQVFVPFTVLVTGDASVREIRWSAVIGQRYQVQYRAGLESGGWLNLDTPVEANIGEVVVIDRSGLPQRFYRVVVVQP